MLTLGFFIVVILLAKADGDASFYRKQHPRTVPAPQPLPTEPQDPRLDAIPWIGVRAR